MMNNNLDRLEARLRTLFEESLLKTLTGKTASGNLIDELLRGMQTNLKQGPEGSVLAPDRYILAAPSEDLIAWQSHQDLLDDLVAKMSEWARQDGFHFPTSPTIEVREDTALPAQEWRIQSGFSIPSPILPDTAAMDQPELAPKDALIPANAFLVVGGKTNFPLQKVVVDIGRHSDNDLVLDDQYTSRHHAQLRAINRRYVIFDVGSTGGIFLNGKSVSQATLHPGDVIRIGMTHLIYIQDTTGDTPTTAVPMDSEPDEANA